MALPFTEELEHRFTGLARGSLLKQGEIEAADSVDFETWRQEYLSPGKLEV